MMKYYQELKLRPQEDDDLYFIWEKLYQQMHLALVENKVADDASSVGVSFPEYNENKFSLGAKLRLFAQEEKVLEQMQCEKWLNRLRDYVQVGPIKPVPEKITGYACFKHIKLNGSKEKLARRRAKRKGEDLQQSLSYFKNFNEQHSKLPYINMTSQTNSQRFRLLIERQEMQQQKTGLFSCYGLSRTTTVPLF
jgi:CRISPR-associated endonuclease Csy4